MGCGSSTATKTAAQPAPKLKRIKEEDENAIQSSPKRSSVKESNGHAKRATTDKESGDKTTQNQLHKVVTPPSSANGHVPHDPKQNAVNNSRVSESSTSDERTNEGTPNNAAPTPGGENAEKATVPKERLSSAQEKQFSNEETPKDVTASDYNTPNRKVDVEEEQRVVVTSSARVGDKSVPNDSQINVKENSVSTGTGATETDLVRNKAASEVSLSGGNNTSPSLEQRNAASVTSPEQGSEAAGTGLAQHRVASQVENESESSPVVDQTKRGSVASDNELNLSRQNRGSLELDSTSPASTEGAQASQPAEISKQDSASPSGKDSLSDQRTAQAQTTDTAKNDSVADTSDVFTEECESIYGKICTLTASVQIGSSDDPQGERTVTLNGSVYRLPRVSSPKPGDKIGFVKGDVTSNNEPSEKVATLRGDLLAVSGEAASHGQIATAFIDVVSCANGEKMATIKADVSPDDDPDNTSGVISGEVRRASEGGTHGEPIGTLAGKVVALTFDEDTVSVTSGEEEYLKPRRESCFI